MVRKAEWRMFEGCYGYYMSKGGGHLDYLCVMKICHFWRLIFYILIDIWMVMNIASIALHCDLRESEHVFTFL